MRSSRIRSLAAALLTGAVFLLLAAASAGATTIPIQGGKVDWGIKESFRNYVKGPIAGGQIETSGGAVEAADGTFRFPVDDGTYDLTTHVVEAQGSGSVHFTGHYSGGVPALDLTFSNPRVIVGPESAVYADMVSKSMATGEVEEFPEAEFALLDASATAPEFEGEAVTLKEMPAELTAEGAEAFAGFYAEGEELDPLTLTAALTATEAPAEEPGTEEAATEAPHTGAPQPAAPQPVATPVPGPAPVTATPRLKSGGGSSTLGGGGSATVARITCPATVPCSLRAPKHLKLKSGGRSYGAKVIAPHWILAGKTAKVAVKVKRAALSRLAGAKAKGRLRLVLGSGAASTTKVVKVTLRRKVTASHNARPKHRGAHDRKGAQKAKAAPSREAR
jgi:hypothetical protein